MDPFRAPKTYTINPTTDEKIRFSYNKETSPKSRVKWQRQNLNLDLILRLCYTTRGTEGEVDLLVVGF